MLTFLIVLVSAILSLYAFLFKVEIERKTRARKSTKVKSNKAKLTHEIKTAKKHHTLCKRLGSIGSLIVLLIKFKSLIIIIILFLKDLIS